APLPALIPLGTRCAPGAERGLSCAHASGTGVGALHRRRAARDADAPVTCLEPSMRKSTRPTVATIARELGISSATVSYALNDKPGVSAAMRDRVLEHARTVGWTPHSGAQALRRGRSGNIGLVLVRDPEEISREPFYSAVTAGIESATSAHGYELMLRFVRGGADEEVDVFRAWAHQRRVDGVVLLDMAADDHRPAVLDALGLDFAVLGHYTGPEEFVMVTTAEVEDSET